MSLQSEAIDVAAEYAQLVGDKPGAAVATFTGYVRDHSDAHAVTELELEGIAIATIAMGAKTRVDTARPRAKSDDPTQTLRVRRWLRRDAGFALVTTPGRTL